VNDKQLSCFARKLSHFSNFLFCHVHPGLLRSLGPLGGSHNEMGLATVKTRFSPAHDLELTLSNRSHGVPNLASKGSLRCLANQSTKAWVQGLKGSGLPGPWL
jgi:hypothetical protein